MAYFLGTHLRDHKKIIYELSAILGLNRIAAERICVSLGWNPKGCVGSLTSAQINQILLAVDKDHLCNVGLRQSKLNIIKALVQDKSYRGFRHLRKLPVRGQRSHTNANTVAKAKWGFIPRSPKKGIKNNRRR